MLEDGTHASINALAEAEKINRAYVCRLLNLTCWRRISRKPCSMADSQSA